MKPDLEKAVKAGGFTKYKDYLADLIKKNDADSFEALIKKLGVPMFVFRKNKAILIGAFLCLLGLGPLFWLFIFQ